jgi:hypothetical protein
MGEKNPRIFTWRGFLSLDLGLSERGDGRDGDPAELERLEEGVRTLKLEPDDLREVRLGDRVMLKASSVAGAVAKFSRIPVGPRLTGLGQRTSCTTALTAGLQRSRRARRSGRRCLVSTWRSRSRSLARR